MVEGLLGAVLHGTHGTTLKEVLMRESHRGPTGTRLPHSKDQRGEADFGVGGLRMIMKQDYVI